MRKRETWFETLSKKERKKVDRAFDKEQKRYEKVQRAIDKKDAKFLEKAISELADL